MGAAHFFLFVKFIVWYRVRTPKYMELIGIIGKHDLQGLQGIMTNKGLKGDSELIGIQGSVVIKTTPGGDVYPPLPTPRRLKGLTVRFTLLYRYLGQNIN